MPRMSNGKIGTRVTTTRGIVERKEIPQLEVSCGMCYRLRFQTVAIRAAEQIGQPSKVR